MRSSEQVTQSQFIRGQSNYYFVEFPFFQFFVGKQFYPKEILIGKDL